jgi:hypothetical protein
MTNAGIRSANQLCSSLGVDLDALRRIVESPHKVAFAFMTGSVVEGRAGFASDIDVRAVCCPAAEHPSVEGCFYRADLVWSGCHHVEPVGAYHLHMVYWPQEVVESLIAKSCRDVASPSGLPLFSPSHAEFLDEAMVAVPLIGSALFDRFREEFNFQQYRLMRGDYLQSQFDQRCGETEAPLLDGRTSLALYRLPFTIHSAVDCYLHARGARTSKDKWRWRNLVEQCGADSPKVKSFIRFAFQAPFFASDAEVKAHISDGLKWCNDLLLELQVEVMAGEWQPSSHSSSE